MFENPFVTFTCAGCGKEHKEVTYDEYEGWYCIDIASSYVILEIKFVPCEKYPSLIKPVINTVSVPYCCDNSARINDKFVYPCWLAYLEKIKSSEVDQETKRVFYSEKYRQYKEEFFSAGGY